MSKKRSKKRSTKRTVMGGRSLLPVTVLIAAVAIIAIVVWPDDSSDVENDTAQAPSGPAEVTNPQGADNSGGPDLSAVERREAEDPRAVGHVDAPVTLVVFSDYQCPYCASWSHDTMPEMMEYVEDGDLRIEWRDLNIFGPESERASRAAYAAGLQDGFWEYHDALFAEGETRSENQLSEQELIALAEEQGLDVQQFTDDMSSEEVLEQVSANQRLGLELGASSTPTFVLGGVPVIGAQPTEVFIGAVDELLEERR